VSIDIVKAELGDSDGFARVHAKTWQAAYDGIMDKDWLADRTKEANILQVAEAFKGWGKRW